MVLPFGPSPINKEKEVGWFLVRFVCGARGRWSAVDLEKRLLASLRLFRGLQIDLRHCPSREIVAAREKKKEGQR